MARKEMRERGVVREVRDMGGRPCQSRIPRLMCRLRGQRDFRAIRAVQEISSVWFDVAEFVIPGTYSWRSGCGWFDGG